MVVALGAESSLVGISHECDWPPWIQHLPCVTTTPIDSTASSGAIDAQVRRAARDGVPVIGIDAGLLRTLAPDLILAQDLCEVCAVTEDGVHALATALDPAPAIHTLRGKRLETIFDDIKALAARIDLSDEADELVAGMRYRLRRLSDRPRGGTPRVICIEWLDPIFLAGHWVPDLIAAAGGTDVGAEPGSHSRVVSLEALEGMAADLVLVAPCGFGLERAELEFRDFLEEHPGNISAPVWLLDGNAFTSRPGPRVVEGVEAIAAALSDREHEGLKRYSTTT